MPSSRMRSLGLPSNGFPCCSMKLQRRRYGTSFFISAAFLLRLSKNVPNQGLTGGSVSSPGWEMTTCRIVALTPFLKNLSAYGLSDSNDQSSFANFVQLPAVKLSA